MEGEQMTRIIPPRGKWEWNLNTIVQLVGLFVILATGVSLWQRTVNRVETLEAWKIEHEAEVKDLVGSASTARAGLISDIDHLDTAVDRLDFRVNALETKGAQVDGTLTDLQRTLADQSGDLKVIREILQRLDKSVGRTGQ